MIDIKNEFLNDLELFDNYQNDAKKTYAINYREFKIRTDKNPKYRLISAFVTFNRRERFCVLKVDSSDNIIAKKCACGVEKGYCIHSFLLMTKYNKAFSEQKNKMLTISRSAENMKKYHIPTNTKNVIYYPYSVYSISKNGLARLGIEVNLEDTGIIYEDGEI